MTTLVEWSMKINCFLIILLLTSCGSSSKKSLIYFKDIKNNYEVSKPIENAIETRILPKDHLSITVSSLNAETNNIFNGSSIQSSGTVAGYFVDKDGYIKFPVLGKIKVSNLTVEEATDKITKLISENYIKNPIVNMYINNFQITVLGEVKSPQTFNIPDGSINIMEALALAGDMTDAGNRENVLVIREIDKTRSTIRINLNNKEALNSPYFYLRQNDIVYVESEKGKLAKTTTISLIISIASLISVVSVIFTRF